MEYVQKTHKIFFFFKQNNNKIHRSKCFSFIEKEEYEIAITKIINSIECRNCTMHFIIMM